MTAPQSTPLPPAPQRGESEDVFVNKSNTWVAAQEVFRQELQEQADFVNNEVVDLDSAVTASAASASAALTSENNASTSESNASASETNATASELAASSSASAASASESNAASSESAASSSATTASNAATAAEDSETISTTKASEASASATSSADSAALSEDARILAQAAGNYAGVWSSLTGSVAAGVSVAHLGEYWGSLVSITDITLSEPGVSSDWQSITELSGTAAQRDTGTDFDQIPLNTNIVYPVATVADLRLLAGFPVGSLIETKGYYTSGDGGGGEYIIASPQTVDDVIDISLNNGSVALFQSVTMSAEQAGFTSGDATSLLQAFASNAGVKEIVFNCDFSTTTNVNLAGKKVSSSTGKAVVTGSGIKNCVLDGLFKKTKPSFVSMKSPAMPEPSQDMKMLIRRGDQAAFVVQANNQGYIRHVIQDGVFTTLDSAGSPAELIRNTGVDCFHEMWVGHGVADTVSGPSASLNTFNSSIYQRLSGLGQLATSSFDKGTGISSYFLSTNGHYVEYQNLEVVDGCITLVIQTSETTTFPTGFELKIDGAAVTIPDIVTNTPSGDRGLIFLKIPVETSEKVGDASRTLRVTHTGATGVDKATVVGCNLFKLRELSKPLSNINWFAGFGKDVSYVSNTGASDYAIFSTDDNKWHGSFHGGETRLSYRVEVDGNEYDYSAAVWEDFTIGREIRVQQSTSITGLYSTYQYLDFSHFGGYTVRASMIGSVNCSKFYTCMSTSDPRFEFLEYPSHKSTATDGKYDIGNNDNIAIQYAPSVGDLLDRRKISNEFTFFDSGDTAYNGAYIQRAGSFYNKLYYGPVNEGQSLVGDIAFTVVKKFF